MLIQRVCTAIALLAVMAGVLSFDSAWPFLIFLALTCGVAGWEWTRLTLGQHSFFPLWLGLGLFALTVTQTFAWLNADVDSIWLIQISAGLSVVCWFIAVGFAIYRAQVQETVAPLAWTSFAMLTLFATWGVLSILYLTHGAYYVLSLLLVVWIADIAAYFVGRAFGSYKLAPLISPGKTREGAVAGIVGVAVWMVASSYWPGSFGADVMIRWGMVGTIAISVLLAVFSICGDLFESLLKRRAGVKDSSQLLPGHGGVYDRIDAVVAVVPLAFILTGGLKF